MKKSLVIIFSVIILLAVYKKQHIQPVDDPKDTPIFQQRLKSSLERFQVDEFPAKMDRMRARRELGKMIPSSPYSPVSTKDLVVAGRCGRVTLTWVEEKKIEKESISIKRKTQHENYSSLKAEKIYERAEEGGIRYWMSDSKLNDGVRYEYLVSFRDVEGKEITKGPISITLTCNQRDREILAQREKMLKEYYQKKPSVATPSPAVARDLYITGRCGRATLTWVEEKKIKKESIRIKRRTPQEEYSLIKMDKIYERAEEKGIRYWVADSSLSDGAKYEYFISYKDVGGKEITKGPISINLTCNERDREIMAQREKMIKEYYQKRGIEIKDYAAVKPPSYQLSEKSYTIELGNSPQKGRDDAYVTMVVFTDFECIHCSTWAETLNTIVKTFPQDVRIVFKNYPLPYHKQSELAASAALAAGQQGKFWEMHNLLFKSRNALDKEDILGYAKTLKLDLSKFKKSWESKALKKMIDQDKAQGKTLGVQNAPTTFINGRSLVGSPPVSYIKGLIENILNNRNS